jgi:hypothetical protein
MEGPLIAFILATFGGLMLSVLSWWFARKAGLAPAQGQLINTLKDNADAMADQLVLIRASLAAEIAHREALQGKVDLLESAIVDLATENALLRRQLGMPPPDPVIISPKAKPRS